MAPSKSGNHLKSWFSNFLSTKWQNKTKCNQCHNMPRQYSSPKKDFFKNVSPGWYRLYFPHIFPSFELFYPFLGLLYLNVFGFQDAYESGRFLQSPPDPAGFCKARDGSFQWPMSRVADQDLVARQGSNSASVNCHVNHVSGYPSG